MQSEEELMSWEQEVAGRERFAFGKNWEKYLGSVDSKKILRAEESLKNFLQVENLSGVTFLDAGSGSGIFSLAARNLGASVYSFDYDPYSVRCTEELRRRHCDKDAEWVIAQGSVLDSDFVRNLGFFDIIYSWGVLHHTGDLWRAVSNLTLAAGDKSQIFVALYNKQKYASRYWLSAKKAFVQYPFLRPFFFIIHFIYPTLPSFLVRFFERRPRERGMQLFSDLRDWLGGYPFEVSTPEEVLRAFRVEGFTLVNLKTVGGRSGCNEYLFSRS